MAKKNYKILQYERQVKLMHETGVFHGDTGYGKFAGKPRPFVLKYGDNNLYHDIVASVKEYFSDNGIAWWRGSRPTGHSVYYQEPFYQLMRQTLWAQAIIDNKDELLNADDYWHLHIIPSANAGLLYREYKVSGMNMEDTWRSMLDDQSKYTIVDPSKLLDPIKDKYPELCEYLRLRYW